MISLGMDLLELAQQGDSCAFEQLIRPHIASIRRFAYAFSRDWDDADDLAQEALIKAFRALPSFEGRSSLSTWLYALTRNLCHDHYRGRMAKTRALEEPLDESQLDTAEGAEAWLAHKADVTRLWEAVKLLEPTFRAPLVLCDIEELSYENVAQIEGVPIGTIRSRLSRARERLRRLLSEEPDPPVSGAREPALRSLPGGVKSP
jgi:RNA polymerase sigma-70 factor, ECF subfamily